MDTEKMDTMEEEWDDPRSPILRKLLLETLPEWDWKDGKKKKWQTRFDKLKAFMEKWGRLPTSYSGDEGGEGWTNEDEKNQREIYSWLFLQKVHKRMNVLTENQLSQLDPILSEFPVEESPRNVHLMDIVMEINGIEGMACCGGCPLEEEDEEWLDDFLNVHLFIENNARYPSSHSKDTEEKKFGKWIAEQRKLKLDHVELEKKINHLF